MKSTIFLLSFCPIFAMAQWLGQTPSTPMCQCPEVKCDASTAATLCQCRNYRETLCKRACPEYRPTYLPCPINPSGIRRSVTPLPPTPPPSPKLPAGEGTKSCECESRFCIMAWPQSCHCQNANKQACFEKCGGVKPDLAECPPIDPPTLITLPSSSSVGKPKPTTPQPPPKPTTNTTKPIPSPNPTHAICGGGRPNYLSCDEGYICIKDPYRPGCGPECDGLGICVEDKMCGGFAGFACGSKGQVCWDDPRDDCVTGQGGYDCAGVCVWPH